jgi:hypothetical protein
MMATAFKTKEEAQARYDEIAKGLLSGDATGTKFGHNQVRLNDGGQFETFDLRYKQGDPGALAKQGDSAVTALNQLVNEFGLDTSAIAKGQGLGSVRYDPGAGVKTDAKTLFDNLVNANLKAQLDAKIGGIAPPAPPAEPAPAAAPPPALEYGQPAAQTPPATFQPNPSPAAPQGLASLEAPPAASPHYGTAPGATPNGAPGFQAMPVAVNNLPRGPAIGGQYAQATAAGDPFMSYKAPQYRTPLGGDQAYDQMGLDLLSRYGMAGGEHNFLPNRSTFAAVEAAKRYGEGSTIPTTKPQTEAEKAAAAVYASMRA